MSKVSRKIYVLTLCCELQRHKINSSLLIMQNQTSDKSLSLGKENTWNLGLYLLFPLQCGTTQSIRHCLCLEMNPIDCLPKLLLAHPKVAPPKPGAFWTQVYHGALTARHGCQTFRRKADICLCLPLDRTWHKINEPKVDYSGDWGERKVGHDSTSLPWRTRHNYGDS